MDTSSAARPKAFRRPAHWSAVQAEAGVEAPVPTLADPAPAELPAVLLSPPSEPDSVRRAPFAVFLIVLVVLLLLVNLLAAALLSSPQDPEPLPASKAALRTTPSVPPVTLYAIPLENRRATGYTPLDLPQDATDQAGAPPPPLTGQE